MTDEPDDLEWGREQRADGGHDERADGGREDPDDAPDRGEDDAERAEYEPPEREVFAHDPVRHAEVRAGMTVGELADEYGRAGVGAAPLHEAVDVTAAMFDEDVTVFMGLAGAMVPTGMRRIVADLIRDGYVDALVTTGANLTHDAIEAIGGKHHHGSATPTDGHPCGGHGADGSHGAGDGGAPSSGHGSSGADDSSEGRDSSGGRHDRGPRDSSAADRRSLREHDERLRDEEVDRIYNVYLPQEHFAELESHLREEVFPPLESEGTVSIERFTREIGRANADVNEREGVDEAPGIAAAAYEHDVPIYAPAVQDSVIGLQAWMYSQTSDFSLDALADMTPLSDMAFEAEEAGAFVVGGGVPKNFVLQTMLVSPDAYDYAVQLTMDSPRTGGLSGATLDEARSWGKLEKDAENVSVYADATITLPLVVAAARERLEGDGS